MIERGQDGCYHPRTEPEIAELVAHAHSAGKQLRVLGSSHSVWRAIVTDRFAGPETPADEIQIVLDKYTEVFAPKPDPERPDRMWVEVQAGCHLGASPLRPVQGRIAPGGARHSDVMRPSPWHDETWKKSFNYRLHHDYGLALCDLGGISHQTIAGFVSTGSSGGTTKWAVHDDIVAMRVIDGTGKVHVLTPTGDRAEWFRSAAVGMGLCGVISTVTFRCEPRYDVIGSETISETAQSDDVDFYGNRPGSGLPSLEQFLLDTDYVRIMWWPQWKFDRLVLWQAKRAPYDPDMKIDPYHEIAVFPVLSQVAISVIYTVLGNIDTPERILDELRPLRARAEIRDKVMELDVTPEGVDPLVPPPDPALPVEPQHLFAWISALIGRLTGARHDPITLGAAWVPLVQLLIVGSDELVAFMLKLPLLKQLFGALGKLVPAHLKDLYALFITTGDHGSPATQHFQDRWFLGLPMDNQMDDLLLPTWFTELWIPFSPGDGTVNAVIQTLRKQFDADGTPEKAYLATGAFAFELYAAKASDVYLSPATGKQNVFRVDVFWFARNAGDPVTDFYPQFWKSLEPFNYRLHWGKFLPEDPGQRNKHLQQYPELARWKKVRAKADPKGVFLTRYWKKHLEL